VTHAALEPTRKGGRSILRLPVGREVWVRAIKQTSVWTADHRSAEQVFSISAAHQNPGIAVCYGMGQFTNRLARWRARVLRLLAELVAAGAHHFAEVQLCLALWTAFVPVA
jgi:hypothetical protein